MREADLQDRATVSGASERGHTSGRGRRSQGLGDCRGVHGGSFTSLHPDPNDVPRLHPEAQGAGAPAHPGGLDSIHLCDRRGGGIRDPKLNAGRSPQRACAGSRRRSECLEQWNEATEVCVDCRAAVERAGGAVRAICDELAGPDRPGDRGLQLCQERVRDGQVLEVSVLGTRWIGAKDCFTCSMRLLSHIFHFNQLSPPLVSDDHSSTGNINERNKSTYFLLSFSTHWLILASELFIRSNEPDRK